MGLGSLMGSILSSYILRAVGNVYLLLIVATLDVISYAYTNVWIKESLVGAVKVQYQLELTKKVLTFLHGGWHSVVAIFIFFARPLLRNLNPIDSSWW